eukprot:gene10430-14007_t
MTYTLITANRNYSSWSLRPWVLMTMLDIPFEDRIEPFAADSNYEAFRAFSPTGQVPALLDGARTGNRIVVYDNTSYEVGPGIAEYLANQGKEVIFVTMDSGLAMSVTEIGINKLISNRLLPKVRFIPTAFIKAIDPSNVMLVNIYTGETTVLEDVDNIILVTSKPPEE